MPTLPCWQRLVLCLGCLSHKSYPTTCAFLTPQSPRHHVRDTPQNLLPRRMRPNKPFVSTIWSQQTAAGPLTWILWEWTVMSRSFHNFRKSFFKQIIFVPDFLERKQEAWLTSYSWSHAIAFTVSQKDPFSYHRLLRRIFSGKWQVSGSSLSAIN